MMKRIFVLFILIIVLASACTQQPGGENEPISGSEESTNSGGLLENPNSVNQQLQEPAKTEEKPPEETKTTPPPEEKATGISLSVLAQHDKEGDCWVAYEGKTYDITNFIPNHKDYRSLLVPLCGTSEEFEKKFEGKHGKSKVEVLFAQGIYKGDLTA